MFQIVRGADNIVGDQMRHMRGDGQHQIVMVGIHDFHVAAERAPEGFQCFQCGFVRARRRCQNAPAPVEQLCEARFGARLLGAGDGMSGNEMHAIGNMRTDIADHGAFHRSDIAEDGAGLKMSAIASASEAKLPTGVASTTRSAS